MSNEKTNDVAVGKGSRYFDKPKEFVSNHPVGVVGGSLGVALLIAGELTHHGRTTAIGIVIALGAIILSALLANKKPEQPDTMTHHETVSPKG